MSNIRTRVIRTTGFQSWTKLRCLNHRSFVQDWKPVVRITRVLMFDILSYEKSRKSRRGFLTKGTIFVHMLKYAHAFFVLHMTIFRCKYEKTDAFSVFASGNFEPCIHVYTMGSSPGRVKPETIKLVFVASPLSTQH
jgi:hypothetical protein